MSFFFRSRRRPSIIGDPELKSLEEGTPTTLLQPVDGFMDHTEKTVEKLGKSHAPLTKMQKEEMIRGLEHAAADELMRRSIVDPKKLIRELEERRDGTASVNTPARYLTTLESKALQYSKANIINETEDMMNMTNQERLRRISEIAKKKEITNETDIWRLQTMMYYNKVYGNSENYGGEQKLSSFPFENEFGSIYDGHLPDGRGYNDFVGGHRKKRKTKKRKFKKVKSKKKSKKRRKKTYKRKMKKYKKKSRKKR